MCDVLGTVSTSPVMMQLFLSSYSSLRNVLRALPHLAGEQIKAQRGSAIGQDGLTSKRLELGPELLSSDLAASQHTCTRMRACESESALDSDEGPWGAC